MIENVTIVDKNGNGILAEGLMFIHIKSTDIKYVFYTLNEIANGNRVKIYIAETADEVGKASPIDEDEWEFLKKTIISVAHKEEMPDIEHIKMTGVTFNISEPKKLAIEMQVKEALKEAQFARARSNENAQEEALFVDSSMLENKSEEVPVVGNSQSNIFENPPTPIETTPEIQNQAIDVQNTTPIPNSIAGNGLMDQSGLIGEPLMTDMLANSSLIDTPVLAEEPALGETVPAEETTKSVLTEEPTLVAPESIDDAKSEVQSETTKITQEEAIRCLETVLKYIKQNKEIKNTNEVTLENSSLETVEKTEEVLPLAEEPQKIEEQSIAETVPQTMPEETTSEIIEENPVVETPTFIETPAVIQVVPGLEEAIAQSHSGQNIELNSSNELQNSLQIDTNDSNVMNVDNGPELEMPQTEFISTPTSIPEINDVMIQNPMSFEATGTNVQMIDTSLQGLQQEVRNSGYESPLNPGVIPVNFESPTIAPQNNNPGVMQPSSPAPVDNYIPDVTPTAPVEETYIHQAINNNGKVNIVPEPIVSAPGLDVVMPDNAKNVQMVTEGMHGQGTLGPSGLNASAPNVLNLMN